MVGIRCIKSCSLVGGLALIVLYEAGEGEKIKSR